MPSAYRATATAGAPRLRLSTTPRGAASFGDDRVLVEVRPMTRRFAAAGNCSDDAVAPTIDRPRLGRSLEAVAYLARTNFRISSPSSGELRTSNNGFPHSRTDGSRLYRWREPDSQRSVPLVRPVSERQSFVRPPLYGRTTGPRGSGTVAA